MSTGHIKLWWAVKKQPDSFNIYHSLVPFSPTNLPVPVATGISATAREFRHLDQEHQYDHYYRIASVKNGRLYVSRGVLVRKKPEVNNKRNFILLDIPKIESALQNDSIQYFGFVVPWYGERTHPTLVYWSKHWLEGIKTSRDVVILFLRYLQAEYFRYLSAISVGLYNSPIYFPEVESEWETDLTIADMGVYDMQGNDLRQLLLEAIGQEHITLHKLADIGNHPDVTPCSTTIYKNDSKAHFLDFNYDNYDNFDASKLKYQGVFGTDTGDNLIFDMWQAIVPPSDNRYVTSYLGKLNWTPIGIDANGNYTMTFK